MNFKEIPYERIEVSSEYLKNEYQNVNRFGCVPAASINGFLISESMAILEYLEELFPKSCLLVNDCETRARVRRICEYVNSSIHSPQNRSALEFWKPGFSEVNKKGSEVNGF
jgi:glutathione S-transferase